MKKISLLLIIVTAVLFTGCASYQANSLSALDPEFVRSYQEIEGVSIGCKAYSLNDCYTYLDRNVISQGYLPIQLTFQNKTSKRYIFSTKEVSLPCASPEEVARTVHTATFWRLIFFGIIDGIKSSNANSSLDKDFYDKAKDHFVIGPHSFSKTLIFVPKAHFSPVFDVSLLDEETGKHKVVGLSVIR